MSFQLSPPETAKESPKRSTGVKRRFSSSVPETQENAKHRKNPSTEIAIKSGYSHEQIQDSLLKPGLFTNHTDYSSIDFHQQTAQPHYLEFHRVDCVDHEDHTQAVYSDCPRLYKDESRVTPLHGQHLVVQDILGDGFAADHPLVSFIIVKDYDCGSYYEEQLSGNAFETVSMPKNIAKALEKFKGHLSFLKEDGPKAVHTVERIYPISQELKLGISQLEKLYPQYEPSEEDGLKSLVSPYLGIYHLRETLDERLMEPSHDFDENQILHVKLLVEYILTSHAKEYHEADREFANKVVTKPHFSKLFASEEIIIQQTDEGPTGLFVSSIVGNTTQRIDLKCWSWEFDGQFYKQSRTVTILWPSEDDQVSLVDLGVFPLRTADGALKERLETRGQQFWKCRKRRLVEYDSLTTTFEFQTTRNRYMIDLSTYKQMHSNTTEEHDRQDSVGLDSESPPSKDFSFLLPATIRGYGFHDKKWSRLSVEGLRDVEWNSDTFTKRLVLKQKKKDLIEALITVHNSPSLKPQKTDIIEGKAKGLIILLHGGPGTGKTLTAESIAEYAQCPLYRVTCGDIGTDPESVEKYLETVLYIGTLWRCVVLLDEADVFLEERTPTDLQRNALVSVFLRTLEYFEGVLVLTSNRVGTFDEAFKSRVQLAIHYPPLSNDDRFEIWRMFFNDMLHSDEKTKHHELRDKLELLARQKMNGRQIRNIINTARQLARFKGEHLCYSHIDQALDVAKEFEDYVTATRGHTDEEFAKEERLR